MIKRVVFPNHYHGPYVVTAALIGAAIGLLHQLYWPIHQFLFPRFGSFFDWTPLVALLLAITITMAMRRRCPHSRWRFVFAAAAAAGALVTMVVFDPFNGAPRPTTLGLAAEVLAALIVGGLIWGLIGLGLWKLRDAVYGAPRIQDGFLCVYCAYVIRGLPEPRCPECGQAIEDADIDPKPRPASDAWQRLGVRTASVLLVGYVVFLLFPYVLSFGLVRSAMDVELALTYLRLRPEAAAKALSSYLDHPDNQTRSQAAFALMEFPACSESTKDALRRLALSDSDAWVRQMAIQSIGRIDSKLLESMLPALLRDSVPMCRWMALANASPYEAGVIDPKHWAIPYLIEALDDPDVTNRGYIHQRLVALTGKRFPYSSKSAQDVRRAQQADWRDWWRTQSGTTGAATNP